MEARAAEVGGRGSGGGALTCDALQQAAHVEDALLHDALEAHGEDGDEGHGAQQQDPRRQEDGGGLPEPAGDLPEVHGVRAAQDALPVPRHLDAAAVDAQRGLVRLGGAVVPRLGLGYPREPHQPVGAHEGDQLPEGRHDAQQGPQHGAARHDHVAHGGAARARGRRSRASGNPRARRVPRCSPGAALLSGPMKKQEVQLGRKRDCGK